MSETLSSDDECLLRAAGAAGLTYNVPLSAQRVSALIEMLRPRRSHTAVDLGCGRGALLIALAQQLDGLSGTGIDTDAELVHAANEAATLAGVGERIRFDARDAANWHVPVDLAICVGSRHVFSSAEVMFERLAELIQPGGSALVGDGFWMRDPDAWCRETFGRLSHGLEETAAQAHAAGFTVIDAQASTQEEWDDFEVTWTRGVEAVGSESARAFVARRRHDYREHYRGVLGFGWWMLARHGLD